MLEQFKKTGKEALSELKKISDMPALEQFRIKYLSRKGRITQMLGEIGSLPREIKPEAGQLANKVKNEVTQAFEQLKNTLTKSREAGQKELIDVTLPGIPANIGKKHIIKQTLSELLEIFGRMGFNVA